MEQQKLGKYELRGELGKGAAGIVYEGWDPVLACPVAIKTVRLPPIEDEETEQQLARFQREAQAAAKLRTHPNIVPVYDSGRIGDLAFIVMEFIDGGSVKERLAQRGALPPAEAIRLVRQVLAGLAASHAIGIVHRDIKPANIMLRGDEANRDVAKIADFGIARVSSSQMTQAGTVIGTPAYMSPEQFRGDEVDPRTDIWSTGVLLYQMLTGQPPFEGSGFAAIMNKVLNTEPLPPSEVCLPGQVPPALDRAVMKALDKRLTPDGRFATAAAFSQALRDVFEKAPGPADPDEGTRVFPPARPPGRTPARRRPVLSWVGAAAALLLVTAGGGWWWLSDRGAPPRVAVTVPAPTPVPSPPIAVPARPPSQVPLTPLPSSTSPSSAISSPAPLPANELSTATTAPPSATEPPSTATMAPVPATEPPATATVMVPIVPPPKTQPAGGAPPLSPPSFPGKASVPPASGPSAQPDQQQLATLMKPPSVPLVPPPATAPPPGLADLRALLTASECTLISGTLETKSISLYGLAASDQMPPIAETWQALRNAAPLGVSYQFAVMQFERVPAYCEALDAIRPFAGSIDSPQRALVVRLDSHGVHLREQSPFSLAVTMPDFAGWLQIDYFSGDEVAHLGLAPAGQGTKVPTLPAAVRLGASERAAVYKGIATDPGTDLVVAIAARDRLFLQPRPESEPAAAYLDALRAALRERSPAALSADAIRVITVR